MVVAVPKLLLQGMQGVLQILISTQRRDSALKWIRITFGIFIIITSTILSLNIAEKDQCHIPIVSSGLDDQTQVDSKPAGQPEHASHNQCQLIATNGCQNWCSGHPQLVVEIRYLCNVIDAGALIGPCSHVTSRCCLIW